MKVKTFIRHDKGQKKGQERSKAHKRFNWVDRFGSH